LTIVRIGFSSGRILFDQHCGTALFTDGFGYRAGKSFIRDGVNGLTGRTFEPHIFNSFKTHK
jgi:hypothetical protein